MPVLAEQQEEATGRLAARVVSKVGVLVPPWLLLGLTSGAGALSHAVWGGPDTVTWAAVGATLGTTGLSALTWTITHARRALGRVHATATVASVGGWVTVTTVTGLDPAAVTGALWWAGGGLALSWNLRTVIRHVDPDHGTGGDALGSLFDRAKEQAGLKGARARAKEVTGRKVKGVLSLPPGEATVDDAQRALGRLESGMQVPPGTIALAPDPDRADRAEITLSDPRVLRQPIPWPGPSRTACSIADPIRVGVWQDGDDAEFTVPGRHLQVMGTTGSGKSIGGAWNFLSEVMTRPDARVLAFDTSKDEQTLGPCSAGLGRVVTDHKNAVAMLRTVHAQIPQRTRWLAQHGYSKWEKACGLTYLVLWIEEASKFMAALSGKDEDRLEEVVKEARSAGVSIVLSLQRSDYTQMPTLVRGQLAKWCFGLTSAEDAKWGLSTRQQKVDTVEPEAWESNYPGMSYLDAGGVSEKHAVMPLRAFDWGHDGRTVMATHAEAARAAQGEVDPLTATLLTGTATTSTGASTPGQNDENDTDDAQDYDGEASDNVDSDQENGEFGDLAADELDEAAQGDPEISDPDATITVAARAGAPIQRPTGEEATALDGDEPQRLPPAQARAALHAWLDNREHTGRTTFAANDPELAQLRHSVGMGRSWTYKVLKEAVNTGRLTVHGSTYTIEPDEPGEPAATGAA